MTYATYNKTSIMNKAHSYRTKHNLSMSDALRAAWLWAKRENIDKAMDATGYDPFGNPYGANVFFAKQEFERLGHHLMSLDRGISLIIAGLLPAVA